MVKIFSFSDIVADSPKMIQLIELAKKFSVLDEPLLITGDTGTGKDVLAQACHQYSLRRENPFLAINCAALPDDVVESELYGHAVGAYPSALEEKKGFFEQADGGSVLLDEIGEMSSRMQVKLLRFINDGTFRRVGEDKQKTINVRIICATQKDLRQLVKKGIFREDLYYRLNVLPLTVPKLVDRKQDILPLLDDFRQHYTKQNHLATVPIFTPSAKELLLRYSWPGNVRQLKNVAYLAMAKTQQPTINENDIFLPELITDVPDKMLTEMISLTGTLDEMCKQFERSVLIKFYEEFPSTRKLSKRLGLSHTAIANKLREYGIKK